MISEYTFEYDLENKKIVSDCKMNPTEVWQKDFPWLYAKNNKYSEVDYEKVGKWMIFASKSNVNSLWNKIKKSVEEGHLWDSKVSTSSPTERMHVIVIYTIDYTDKNDVIGVLDYLETSGIKPTNTILRYKTDEQTRAGVYSRGKQKASIYSSDTIRVIKKPDKKKQTDLLSWGIRAKGTDYVSMGAITSTLSYYMTRTDDPDSVTGLTSRQKYLIQSSWAPIKKDLTGSGVLLLLALFKKYPEEQQHFPFRDIPYDELGASKKFHAHCSNVMYSVSSIIDSLHDSELLVQILQKIGKNHHKNKVQPISFWHLKEVQLEFFEKFMTKETIEAWDKALQVSFGVIAEELQKKH